MAQAQGYNFTGIPDERPPSLGAYNFEGIAEAAPDVSTLTIGGQPYATGQFTPEEAEVIGRSPAAQASVSPLVASPPTPPPPVPAAPPTWRQRLGAADPDAASAFAEIAGPAASRVGPAGMVRGAVHAGRALFTPPSERGAFEPELEPTLEDIRTQVQADVPPTPLPTEAKAGINEALAGAFETMTPLVAAALLTNPVGAAIGVGSAIAADAAAHKAVLALGGDEESARLAGNVVALAVGSGAGDKLIRVARAKATQAVKATGEAFTTAARPVMLSSLLSGSPASGGNLVPPGLGLAGTPENPAYVTQPTRGARRPRPARPAPAPAEAPSAPQPADVMVAGGEAPVVPAPAQAARNARARAEATQDLAPVWAGMERRAPLAGVSPTGIERRDDISRLIQPEQPAYDFRGIANAGGGEPAAATAPLETHTFSSTQVNLPQEAARPILEMAAGIPDEDLAPDGRAGQTANTMPHVTVKYGLHTVDAEKVRKVLADEPPITLTLGTTSFFPNSESDNGDVLKVDVDSPDLHRLNKKIAEALEVTDTHPTYQPHVTIAYLKPGLGQKYEGDDSLKGQTITLDAVTFGAKDGTTTEIPLTGIAATKELPVNVLREALPGLAPPNVSLRDIPLELAQRAYAGTSMVPDERARGEQQGYVEHLTKIWSNLQERVQRTDLTGKEAEKLRAEKQEIAVREFEQFRLGYLQRTREQLSRRSGLVSSMIAGPSNFPVRRMEKRNNAYDKRRTEFIDWEKRALSAMFRAVDPTEARAVSADLVEAPAILQEKIDKAVKLQETMKAANAIIKRAGLTDDERVAELVRVLGLKKETTARKMLEPDFAGRKGFPDYELTNNAANIRRMRARIETIAGERVRPEGQATFEGGRIEENARDNRIQITFDKKPSPELRDKLKMRGFKWAPSLGVWQRQRTDAARQATEALFGVSLSGVSHVETPTAAPRQIPPRGAEERPPSAGIRPQPPKRDRAGDARRRDQEAGAHETAILNRIVAHATSGGFHGDETQLRAELADRLQLIRDLDVEYNVSGRTPSVFLREVARLGGLSVKHESALKGELRWLKENAVVTGTRTSTAFGQVAGVQGVFNEGGLSFDDMVTSLQQDARFSHIRTIDDLFEELRAAEEDSADEGESLAERLEHSLPVRWWDAIGRTSDVEPIIDVLDTGEQPPRLPGEVGTVREQERVTPEFDIPFSLESEVDTAAKEFQRDLLTSREPGEEEPGLAAPLNIPRAPRRHGPPATGGQQLRPSEIVAALSQSLGGLPVRVGRFRKRAAGIYKPSAQVVRLKVANDLDVLAHEIGHHVDEALVRIRSPQVNSELEGLGAATSRPSHTKAQVRKEGAAEFLRLYLSEPSRLSAAAPNYLASFERALVGHPDLAAILLSARRQYLGYLAQSPIDRVLAHVDFKGTDVPPGGDWLMRLETAWVDDLAPLRHAVDAMRQGQPIDVLQDGYRLARLARGAPAKADGFLRFGPRDATGRRLAGSFVDAIDPVNDQRRAFTAYVVASRVVELAGKRGLETGIDLADATATVPALDSPAFRRARQALYDYQTGVLTYARISGALSAKQLTEIDKANHFYVPFQRVQDVLEGALSGAGVASRLANRGVPVKRYRGSGADIINPLESIVRNTHTIVDMVEKNKALRALIEQATATRGGGKFFEAIPPPQEVTTTNLGALRRDIGQALSDAGLHVDTVIGPGGPTLAVEGTPIDLDTLVKVFTPAHFVKGGKGIITVIVDGTPQFYQVNDLALYDAITAIGVQSSDLVLNLFMRPARLLRAGATLTVGFLGRNPVRDTFTAMVNSQYGFRLGYDTLRGLFAFLGKGEVYQQFLNSGAANSSLVSNDRDRIRSFLARYDLAETRRFRDHAVLNPMNLLRALSEAGEEATRLGEFLRGVAAEGPTPEGQARAALAARDVTLDFSRGGRVTKEVNRYKAFFNAQVQGVVRIAEVFRRDPIGMTWRGLLAITIPTLALWYLNRDDPEYQEIPSWEKLAYWHLPRMGGHTFVRVPTPFSLFTVFGAATHAAMDYLYRKDPTVADALFPDKDSAWNAVVAIMPTAILPAIETGTNYDTFRNRHIVSEWDLGLDPALQASRWTSELAKTLGPKIGLAPAKVDHLIYGYTAGLGRTVVKAIDTGAALVRRHPGPPRPAEGLRGTPIVGEVIRAFSRELAGTDAESIQHLYTVRDQLAATKTSIQRFQESGQLEKASALRTEFRDTHGPSTLARASAATEQLTRLRHGMDRVWADGLMSPERKRAEQDRLLEQMVNTARRGLGESPLPSRFERE